MARMSCGLGVDGSTSLELTIEWAVEAREPATGNS